MLACRDGKTPNCLISEICLPSAEMKQVSVVPIWVIISLMRDVSHNVESAGSQTTNQRAWRRTELGVHLFRLIGRYICLQARGICTMVRLLQVKG